MNICCLDPCRTLKAYRGRVTKDHLKFQLFENKNLLNSKGYKEFEIKKMIYWTIREVYAYLQQIKGRTGKFIEQYSTPSIEHLLPCLQTVLIALRIFSLSKH